MMEKIEKTKQEQFVPADFEENEPYLGPAWAVVMLILYLLKEAFPAEPYTFAWWFQVYVIVVVIAVTIFTLVKRHQFYKAERLRRKNKKAKTNLVRD